VEEETVVEPAPVEEETAPVEPTPLTEEESAAQLLPVDIGRSGKNGTSLKADWVTAAQELKIDFTGVIKVLKARVEKENTKRREALL
jgi:hypothetical protein